MIWLLYLPAVAFLSVALYFLYSRWDIREAEMGIREQRRLRLRAQCSQYARQAGWCAVVSFVLALLIQVGS